VNRVQLKEQELLFRKHKESGLPVHCRSSIVSDSLWFRVLTWQVTSENQNEFLTGQIAFRSNACFPL